MNKRTWQTALSGCLLAMLLVGFAAGAVQAQTCGAGPMGSQAGPSAPSPGPLSMMGQGMMGQGMGIMGMMPMMAQMKGRPMDPVGMLDLMDDGQMDPKARGRLLQLRGEMFKAVGEVLLKHGQALEQAQ
jgi:hypothetical protein